MIRKLNFPTVVSSCFGPKKTLKKSTHTLTDLFLSLRKHVAFRASCQKAVPVLCAT